MCVFPPKKEVQQTPSPWRCQRTGSFHNAQHTTPAAAFWLQRLTWAHLDFRIHNGEMILARFCLTWILVFYHDIKCSIYVIYILDLLAFQLHIISRFQWTSCHIYHLATPQQFLLRCSYIFIHPSLPKSSENTEREEFRFEPLRWPLAQDMLFLGGVQKSTQQGIWKTRDPLHHAPITMPRDPSTTFQVWQTCTKA